jgi:hypothetical protein
MESPRSMDPVMVRSHCAVLSLLATLAMVTLPITGVRANDTAAKTVDAIWRTQLVEFTYNSSDVYYSCESLRSKVTEILQAIGAYERIRVEMHCAGDSFANHAYGRVMMAVPTEATPENVRAATTYDTRDVLIARLHQLSLPTANDIERFPAHWRSEGLRLDASDCDLLRALRRQVLPVMPVRIEKERLHCALGASTRIRPTLDVVALMRAPDTDSFYSMQ